MPVAPSFDDLLDQGRAEAQSRRPDLLFADGDVTTAQLHAGAAMADANIRTSAQMFAATFIDLAKGDDLTALVDDHMNIQRQAATPAQVTVTFTRTSGGGGGSIPVGTVVATATAADGSEVRFTTDTLVPVAGGNNGPFNVVATCTATGRSGNVAAGTVTRLLSSLFDATFSVTNAAIGAGGNNEETDQQLRVRARTFWQTLRRGTMAALEFGALTVPAVRVARAIEIDIGVVLVVVSDEDGNSNAQMVADVELELVNWRAAGVVVQVAGAEVLLVNFILELVVIEGFDIIPVTDTIEDAIAGRLGKLRMGERVYLDQVSAATIDVDPDAIRAVNFISPTDNVTVGGFQVPRLGTLTLTSTNP